MGGGNQGASGGAATQTSIQDLMQQMQRQQTWSQIGQGIQKAGSIVGQQQPYMQGGGGAAPSAAAAPPQAGPNLGATGALFPGQGGGIAGIDPQQLAMILQRLGYAG